MAFNNHLIPATSQTSTVSTAYSAQRVQLNRDATASHVIFTANSVGPASTTFNAEIRSTLNGSAIVTGSITKTIVNREIVEIPLSSNTVLSGSTDYYLVVRTDQNHYLRDNGLTFPYNATVGLLSLEYPADERYDSATSTFGTSTATTVSIGLKMEINNVPPEKPVIQNISSVQTNPTYERSINPTFTITTRDEDDENDYGTEIENTNVVVDQLNGTNVLNETKKIAPIYPNSVLTDPTHGLMLSDVGGVPAGWSMTNGASAIVSNRIARFTATAQFGLQQVTPFIFLSGKQYYVRHHIDADSSSVKLVIRKNTGTGIGSVEVAHSGSGNFEALSGIITGEGANSDVVVRDDRTSSWTEIQHTQLAVVNMTDDYPGYTKAEMDALPFDVLRNLLGVQGNFGTDSNADGLADGLLNFSCTNFSLSSNIQSFTPTAQFASIGFALSPVVGHKYFSAVKSKSLKESRTVAFAQTGQIDSQTATASDMFVDSFQYAEKLNNAFNNVVVDAGVLSSGFENIDIKEMGFYDVTQTFGIGQEPTFSQLKELIKFTTGVQFDTQKTATNIPRGATYDLIVRVQDDDSEYSDFSDSAYPLIQYRQRVQLSAPVTTSNGQMILIPSQYKPQQNTTDFVYESFAENDYIQYELTGINTNTANIRVTSKSTIMDGLSYTLPL